MSKKPKYPRAGRYIKRGKPRWSCYSSWGQVMGVRLSLAQVNYYNNNVKPKGE